MIPRSPSVAVFCLAMAGVLHAAIAILPTGAPERIPVEGGGGASISTPVESFADMAKVADVPEPDVAKPVEMPATPPSPTAETSPATEPEMTHAVPTEQAPSPSPATIDRVVAEPETPAPEISVRPRARPETRVRPKRAEPERPPQATPPRPQKQATPAKPQKTVRQQPGNSNRDSRAGEAGKSDTAKSKKAGPAQNAAPRPDSAAVANYPSQVMRQIQRTRRERVNARGSAQVSFTIAANGGLAALSIARSSGSARIDQVALQQIRRAAPFPRPPAGAQRSFTLRIDVR